MTPEQKLTKLESLLKLVDESISKKDFTDSFEAAVKLILSIEEKLIAKINSKLVEADSNVTQTLNTAIDSLDILKQQFRTAIQEAKDANETTFASVRRQAIESIDGLFNRMRLKEKLNSVLGEYDTKVQELNTKIQSINSEEFTCGIYPLTAFTVLTRS